MAAFAIACLLLWLIARTAAPAAAVLPAPHAVAAEPAPQLPPAPSRVMRIAYVTGTEHSPLPVVWAANGAGREPQRLGPGSEPLLAPNGHSVAATLLGGPNNEAGPALALYSTVGAHTREYFNLQTSTAAALAWSPDSRYLAVFLQSSSISEAAQRSGLEVIDTATGAVSEIAAGEIYGASFAPGASDRIVFARARTQLQSAAVNVYESGPTGAGLKRLTSDGHSLYPLWGPRYIAYDRQRLRGNDEAPEYQIWLHSPSGSRTRKLTHVKVAALLDGLVPLGFSADGSRLLAEFGGEDTSEAWTVRVPSGRTHRITVAGQPVVGAGISGSGGTLLIDEGFFENPPSSGRVASIPFGGGRSKVLVGHGAQASWNG